MATIIYNNPRPRHRYSPDKGAICDPPCGPFRNLVAHPERHRNLVGIRADLLEPGATC